MPNNQRPQFDVQSVTDQVTKITTAALTSFFTNEVKTFISDSIFTGIRDYFSVVEPPSSHLRYQLTPDLRRPTSSQDFSG
jgi:hypothetical protein